MSDTAVGYGGAMGAATVQPLAKPLTAKDRCDRCGAQAYVKATLKSGFELLFCAHHWREHGAKVREDGARVQDESGRLAAK
jgi:hypothetical protein